MSIHEDVEIVKQATAQLRETVKEFQQAHEDYHSQIETVKEIKRKFTISQFSLRISF